MAPIPCLRVFLNFLTRVGLVVDSSGWIEYYVGGSNAAFFERPLLDVDDLLVPSISILEVYRYVLRERGRPDALTVAASMRQGTYSHWTRDSRSRLQRSVPVMRSNSLIRSSTPRPCPVTRRCGLRTQTPKDWRGWRTNLDGAPSDTRLLRSRSLPHRVGALASESSRRAGPAPGSVGQSHESSRSVALAVPTFADASCPP
jgi:hypothetical protein